MGGKEISKSEGGAITDPRQTLDRQILDKTNPRQANTRHDKP